MGRRGLHGRFGHHGHHIRLVAMVARVATVVHVAQVATVVPRSITVGALLLFNNSVRTAKKTQHFTITKISLLTLFKEIISVYTENHTNVKEVQTYRWSSRWDRYLPV
jgi:hypothetical protein